MIDRPKKQTEAFDDEEDFGGAFPSEKPTSPGIATRPDADDDDTDKGGGEERPTVSPPFDLEEFARASDSKLRASKPTPGRTEASTAPPPAQTIPVEFDLEEESTSSGKMAAFRPPQITLTDDDELETARLRSVMIPSHPPPPPERREPARRAPAPIVEERVNTPPPTQQYPNDFEEKDPFAGMPGAEGEPQRKAPLPLGELRDRMSLGDYSGALEIAESVLQIDPVNAEAIKAADECRSTLQQMYTARIGPMDRVPVVMVAREQLRWLSIDHRAGFLLSHIDGISSLEMILDVSGMPPLDALRILCELAQQRVISFR